MVFRTLIASAVLAAGIAQLSQADMIAAGSGIAVENSDVNTPARGMTMGQVATKFGAPTTKVPPVGNPPISRWEYPGFVVYFERDHVIHSVVSGGAEPPPAAAEPAPAVSAAPPPPADTAPPPPAAEPAAAAVTPAPAPPADAAPPQP
jgi:hypothetical protein